MPAASYESVAAVIRARATADPDATAITGDGRSLTFGQLDERSSRLARALAGLGVRRRDRVAYLDQNATEFWETMFAAAKLGAVMTPLNFRLAGPELAAILADAEPAVLVAAADRAVGRRPGRPGPRAAAGPPARPDAGARHHPRGTGPGDHRA